MAVAVRADQIDALDLIFYREKEFLVKEFEFRPYVVFQQSLMEFRQFVHESMDIASFSFMLPSFAVFLQIFSES